MAAETTTGRTVWKVPIPYRDRDADPFEDIAMPANAKLLHVGYFGRDATAYLWIEVTQADMERARIRRLAIVGTGRDVPAVALYINTVVDTPRGLVWHVYDCGEV